MAYELKTNHNDEADFYIQSVGSNAGQPMKSSSANCFGVFCNPDVLDSDYFYYAVLNQFNLGNFEALHKGTAQPYITMSDVYSLL